MCVTVLISRRQRLESHVLLIPREGQKGHVDAVHNVM